MSLLCVKAQKNFTVVIDPGHGGRDPGCVGTMIYEKTINLSVALQLGKLIEQNHKDVNVIYTRKTDIFIPLDERANIANRNKADLFISIHVNAVKRSNASGIETYTIGLASSKENLDVAMRENSVILMEDDYHQKYEGFDPNSDESYIIFDFMQNKYLERSVFLASEVQKEFVNIKRGDRGVRQAGFLVLRKTSMPSILIELGFITNREEEKFMATANGQTVMANSIYKAFSSYKYDHDRKQGNTATTSIIPRATANIKDSADSQTTDTSLPNNNNDTATSVSLSEDKNSASTSASVSNETIIYKIQILTSDKELPEKDRRFKGYGEISFYIEKGIYKYTYGATSDYRKILEMHKKATKDFKDAFIIRMKDGKRIYQ